MRICHADVKPDNVVLTAAAGATACADAPPRALLMDFGLSARLPAASTLVGPHKGGARGTTEYVAPEVFANDAPYDAFAADMWSAGMTLFTMLVGFPAVALGPTDADARFRVLKAPTTGVRDLLDHWNVELSAAARDLLTRLLGVEPSSRPTAACALQHPFFNDNREVE